MAEIKILENESRYTELQGKDIRIKFNSDSSVTLTGASQTLKNTVLEFTVSKEEFSALLSLPDAQRQTKIDQLISTAVSKLVVPSKEKKVESEVELPGVKPVLKRAPLFAPKEFTVKLAIGNEDIFRIPISLSVEGTELGTCILMVGMKWLDKQTDPVGEIVKKITSELAYLDNNYYDESSGRERDYREEKRALLRELPAGIERNVARIRESAQEVKIKKAGGAVGNLEFKSAREEATIPGAKWETTFTYSVKGKPDKEIKISLSFYYTWMKEHALQKSGKFVLDEAHVFKEIKAAVEKFFIEQNVPSEIRAQLLSKITIDLFKGSGKLFEIMTKKLNPEVIHLGR